MSTAYAVVIPTLVRGTLADCLAALAAATGPQPDEIAPGPTPTRRRWSTR
jgi:hypothetical protein